MTAAPADALSSHRDVARQALRKRLLAEREAFAASPAATAASEALAVALRQAVAELEPDCLGLYCAWRSEFNAARALAADARFAATLLALPYARREGRVMEFRRWDGGVPGLTDECGIGSATGPPVVPDVVVVPCVGFTADGHRLGYGGGYYDRWLAVHPHVTAIGLAWASAEIEAVLFDAREHDVPLAFIVTERGIR